MGWMAIAGVALTAASSIVGGVGKYNAYKSQAQAAKHEGKYALQRGEFEEDRFRYQARQVLGRHRAISGISGTVTDSGSNLDVLAEAAGQMEIDAQLIRYGAEIDAWRAKGASEIAGSSADTALLTGFMSGGGTILGGASLYEKYFGGGKSQLYSPKLAGPQYPTGSEKRKFH